MPHVLGALWLLGLYAAAPVLRGRDAVYAFADRLRDALVLGVAIPFVLGFAHLLYPIALWIVLLLLVILSAVRRAAAHEVEGQPLPLLLIAAVAFVAWPPLMRPVLDGDSLSYHLPNAAAWVHAHSVWTTDPRYWWYPPASELFASALYAVSGPAVLPWSGAGALLLLGYRVYGWARAQYGARPLLADATAAAVVTALPLALQAGSLQNDVWLTAFFVDFLLCARRGNPAASRSAAVTALLKPYGIVFVVAGAIFTRARWRVWLSALVAFALWAMHDAVLWRSAFIPPGATSYSNGFDSTIVAHGAPAIGLLAEAAFRSSPFVALTLLVALLGPLLAEVAPLAGRSAFAALLFYLVMPLGYAGPGPQLATGASLRYASPAIALGALTLVPLMLSAEIAATIAMLAFALFGCAKSFTFFFNDLPTTAAPGVALLTIAAVLLARRARSAWPVVALVACAVLASGILAARQPVAYYADAFTYAGKRSGLYDWLARRQPAVAAGNGLALGTVNVLSPRSRAIDLGDADPCAQARAANALLVAVAEPERSETFDANRLRSARACGTVLYDDGIAVVTQP
ncbi:MAG: hypothetical protein JO175_01485 [Candidatus Eremiobacteraeota bacterium]|nr:hypothetical protein [Candidatus Eremiobacteraeota bacterium]